MSKKIEKWPKIMPENSEKMATVMFKKYKNFDTNGENNAEKSRKNAAKGRNKMHLENFDTSKFNVKIRNIFCIYFYENLKNVKND